nr:unnamed protein product [Digitaria exilis]
MGCGASTADGAEPRRRGWARVRGLGGPHSGASTTGLPQQQGHEAESPSAGRRRGCKVAPEPGAHDEEAATGPALRPMPGSPSFRYYCQKTAFVDKIVADADDGEGSVRIRAALVLKFLGSSFSSSALQPRRVRQAMGTRSPQPMRRSPVR